MTDQSPPRLGRFRFMDAQRVNLDGFATHARPPELADLHHLVVVRPGVGVRRYVGGRTLIDAHCDGG